MKVIIELPEKYLDIAKSFMILTYCEELEEQELTEYVDRAKAMKEPIPVDLDEVYNDDKEKKQFYVCIAAIVLGVVGKTIEEEKKQ